MEGLASGGMGVIGEGYGISFWSVQNILEQDNGGGRTTS